LSQTPKHLPEFEELFVTKLKLQISPCFLGHEAPGSTRLLSVSLHSSFKNMVRSK